jgi:NAD(P)H-dependent FMN reductase
MHTYAIICGSQRRNSQSLKVGQYLQSEIKRIFPKDNSWILDLSENKFPFLDADFLDNSGKWSEELNTTKAKLQESDGLIVITPEWQGIATAAVKNFFLLVSKQEVGHKPALLVSVSAGRGGAYPIAELRMSSYKNNRIAYLPEHLIIRDVQNVLNKDQTEDKSDLYIRERVVMDLKLLKEYTKAFKSIRGSEIVQEDPFGNGM